MATTKTSKTKGKSLVLENQDKYPYHCSACGKGYIRQQDNFNRSPSPYWKGNDGYLTICKRCLESSFNYYKNDVFNGDEDKAMELLCASINTVYDAHAWDCSRASPKSGKSKISSYFSRLNLLQSAGVSYADTILNRENNKTENAPSVKAVEENPQMVTPVETVQRFGLGFSDRDYEVLQFEYNDWVEKYGPPVDKRQDELYKTICYLKLQLQSAVQNRDASAGALAKNYKEYINAATTELEDRQQKQEDSVKLDPYGVWLSEIERYAPAEYYKDKKLFRDADGIGSYFTRFLTRPIKNLLTGSKELDKEFSLSAED